MESVGSFFLGRRMESGDGGPLTRTEEPILYDAKDLTTHGVCIGMTGSGKTGLAITLLEEAAIDGIPVIAIDPKGDLANLLLTFPKLRAEDFAPWIDEAQALRKGRTVAEHAEWTANLWRNGLAGDGQSPARIRTFMDAVDRRVFTPGSTAGEPLAVLRSFDAPGRSILGDEEALRDRIVATASGLLGLIGIDADPMSSREHILLSNVLDHAWREGRSLDLVSMIQAIQSPPFDRVGAFDLESFFAADDRFELALRINNLLASPGFSAWTQGQPLDVGRLLNCEDGRPRLSVISIAHLDDAQRMFFVSTLLSEILAWTRAQKGTSSLRALVYMDEVFGYLPPVANPPSKKPLLTLLKQARAFGVGIVLSTQNPVDLDYKALSNIGTWWLGRLQTERDKARVLDGLEGIAAGSGALTRARLDQLLSSLDSRIFLMQNVHDERSVLMHTRWALSYLGGPLQREQLKKLREASVPMPAVASAAPAPSATKPVKAATSNAGTPPSLPPDVPQRYLDSPRALGAGQRMVYRAALCARATLHHVKSTYGVDEWSRVGLCRDFDSVAGSRPWEDAERFDPDAWSFSSEPMSDASWAEVPRPARDPKRYKTWERMLKTALYSDHALTLLQCRALKMISDPGESEADFRGRVRDRVREERDLAVQKLRAKMQPKVERLDQRIRTAALAVEREQSQHRQKKTDAALTLGAGLLGALFDRKLTSARNVGRATSAARAAGRISREKDDVKRQSQKLEDLRDQRDAMEHELEEKLNAIRDEITVDNQEITELSLAPRKSDIQVDDISLLWRPYLVDANGIAVPGW